MNETKQTTKSHVDGVTRSVFWGTIAMSGITLLVYAYFFTFLLRQAKTPVIYIALTVFLISLASAVISIVLTIRRQQEIGAKLTFYSLFFMGITIISVFQGRTQTASLSILVISVIAILYLLPSQWRRWYYAVTATATIAMWIIEWINPPWRVEIAAATVGPAAVILFGIIFGVLLFLQTRETIANRFLSLSLRVKLLVSIVSITGLALLVYGIIFLYRTQQSQVFWSDELQNTVQEQSQQQITGAVQLEANAADQSLSRITYAVQQLADYQSTLFTSESYLGQGGYWDGNSKLIAYPDGQYGNSLSDPSTIFIPNTVTLSPRLLAELNTSRYLDFSAPAILKENPNIVALYFDSANNYTVYYPNIDLVSLVPGDFTPITQSFYMVAAPENNPEHKAKWTDPYQDPAGTGLIVTVSVPVYDQKNRFRGVMSADVQLTKISEQISTIKLGESGFAFLIDPSGHILAMPEAGYKLFGVEPEVVPVGESPKTTILGLGSTETQAITQKMVNGENGLATAPIQDTQYYVAYAPLPTIGYSIGLIAPRAELDVAYLEARAKLGKETQTTRNLSILILLVVLLAAGGISLLLGQFLAKPLTELTETAIEVSKGNLNSKAVVRTSDEIGILASTFNTMTARLQDILESLENRVADRTRNLELAAEVGRSVSQVRALDVMLKDAAELIRSQFDLYYVQVYLADSSQTNLLLLSGTGQVGEQLVGRGHRLPLNISSINGRAAIEKKSVIITNAAASPTFKPNPLLPNTRSEMAVPLLIGERVVGVLDMQSENVGALSQDVLPAFEALAGQLAIAIQNANLLAEAEQARDEVEAQARRLSRANWVDYLDAIHKPEETGFMFEQNRITALTQSEQTQTTENGNALVASISVTGETLGNLVVEMEGQSPIARTEELVNTVARQVAQQIESLRLLDSAERYRFEAEEASRRLTREGWKDFREANANESMGYFYDLKEVRSLDGNRQDETALSLPLKVRDEIVGKLAIQGLDPNDSESIELANAVAERLSAHIESLRQFEETKRGQIELDKRAQQLASVAEISTVSSKELDINKMLASVVHLTQRKFGLYHVHVFIYNENMETLKIAACGWKEGDEHEGTHGTAIIPFAQEQSLVARAARTRQPVIVNNVHNEPGWLPNPLLPDTASELAVPLLIGDRILGVLDVQADHINAFTEEDANIQTTLASQVATALQNARSFVQAQKQAERESMLNTISQKIQSATTVEAVLQIAARELGHALGAPMTIAQLSMKDKK